MFPNQSGKKSLKGNPEIPTHSWHSEFSAVSHPIIPRGPPPDSVTKPGKMSLPGHHELKECVWGFCFQDPTAQAWSSLFLQTGSTWSCVLMTLRFKKECGVYDHSLTDSIHEYNKDFTLFEKCNCPYSSLRQVF